MIINFKKQNIEKQKGSLLFEMLIVISLVAIILSVGTNAVFLSMRSSKASGERDVANTLASGALESTKAITEENWQNIYGLTKSTQHYYPSELEGKWVLVEGNETININDVSYTRYLIIENVSRDSSTRNIESSYVSDNDDPSTQKVTVTVGWSDSSPVTVSEYFFRWRNKICNQTEWTTSEPGNTVKECPAVTYDEKEDAIDLTTSGSLKLVDSSPAQEDYSILVVAGGGGSGGAVANAYGPGGGGAGGYILSHDNSYFLTSNSYTVTVGLGGSGGAAGNNYGSNGEDSVFDTLTAVGGGGGAGNDNVNSFTGNPGGSGGGGSRGNGDGGAGVSGQGNKGGIGNNLDPHYGGGGGGGATSVGGNGTANDGGTAGTGISSNISGSDVTYATGGKGGSYQGGYNSIPGEDNTGNGGSAGSTGGASIAGSDGGSGVVIISYPTASTFTATGGTKTVVGSNTIHTFTASGTFAITMP